MSLRLAPLNKFHAYLCSLNYYDDFNEEQYNKELDENIEESTKPSDLQEIPLTFDNPEEYMRIWRNLFYVEAKAQIERSEQVEVLKYPVLSFNISKRQKTLRFSI